MKHSGDLMQADSFDENFGKDRRESERDRLRRKHKRRVRRMVKKSKEGVSCENQLKMMRFGSKAGRAKWLKKCLKGQSKLNVDILADNVEKKVIASEKVRGEQEQAKAFYKREAAKEKQEEGVEKEVIRTNLPVLVAIAAVIFVMWTSPK